MNLHQEIKTFILQNFLFSTDVSSLGNTDSLMHKGVIDSTGILELVMHLEESYGIKVKDEEMLPANLDSIDSIAAFVARKRGS